MCDQVAERTRNWTRAVRGQCWLCGRELPAAAERVLCYEGGRPKLIAAALWRAAFPAPPSCSCRWQHILAGYAAHGLQEAAPSLPQPCGPRQQAVRRLLLHQRRQPLAAGRAPGAPRHWAPATAAARLTRRTAAKPPALGACCWLLRGPAQGPARSRQASSGGRLGPVAQAGGEARRCTTCACYTCSESVQPGRLVGLLLPPHDVQGGVSLALRSRRAARGRVT
jgi:hypothetical protein